MVKRGGDAQDGIQYVKNVKDIENANINDTPTMLLFSDHEGCSEKYRGGDQSTVLCQPETFMAIDKFLSKKNAEEILFGNKVAFLGDYFDKGPHVISTINGIVKLKQRYPDNVHIILGNRDVNKLRLHYELTEANDGPIQKYNSENVIYDDWKKSFSSFNGEKTLLTLLNFILNETMGAPTAISKENKTTTNNNDDSLILETGMTYEDGMKILINIFCQKDIKPNNTVSKDTPYSKFIENVEFLYSNANIVHYDTDFKILLSHASGGGLSEAIFHTQSYYNRIHEELNGKLNTPYFELMELYRTKLLSPPTGNEIQTGKPFDTTPFNTLLQKVVATVFNKSSIVATQPSPNYFLLQAMGLSDKKQSLTSFITGCEFSSNCQFLSGKLDNTGFNSYVDKAKQLGIDYVAHGHMGACIGVPLVFKHNDLIFLSCDTTQGYRPKKGINGIDLTLENIPILFVKKKGVFEKPIVQNENKNVQFIKEDTITGITSLTSDGTLNNTATYTGKSDKNLKQKSFNISTIPTLSKKDKLNSGFLTNNTTGSYSELLFNPLSNDSVSALAVGGKKVKKSKTAKKKRSKTTKQQKTAKKSRKTVKKRKTRKSTTPLVV